MLDRYKRETWILALWSLCVLAPACGALIGDSVLNDTEQECLAFLKEFMPGRDHNLISDAFLLQHVRGALRARAAFPWASTVPWGIFLNEVLPYSFLNEPREAWQEPFWTLFSPMVSDASSIQEAFSILNKGIWRLWGLHFKSDQAPEILSPSQVIEAGYGSCSALSIFLAAACRSVGIPARVTGTASWVTDRRGEERFNNHNWVEVWDTYWSFAGALEFNPLGLNRSWFFPQPAKQQVPHGGIHAIYSSSYKTTEDGFFPLAWNISDTSVNGVDVTQYYVDAPVQTAPRGPHGTPSPRPQVFGFSDEKELPNYEHFDWSVVTTVAWRNDPALVQMAHTNGVQVVAKAGVDAEILDKPETHRSWVLDNLGIIVETGLDGINFDFEEPMKLGSPRSESYTLLVKEMSKALHTAIPGSQLSVDVPWSPYDVDGRNYDWVGLAEAADVIFVMAYDMQSQIWGRCVASANSPLALVRRGLQQWLDLGLAPHKLVLGLPWYGYDYECQADPQGRPAGADVAVCFLAPYSFVGSTCSDGSGKERCYSDIMTNLLGAGRNSTPVQSDESQSALYFNYVDDATGRVHQVWFDDPSTLKLRYALAEELGLGGVGVWNLDCLDYFSPGAAAQQTRDMWKVLPHYSGEEYAVAGGGAAVHRSMEGGRTIDLL